MFGEVDKVEIRGLNNSHSSFGTSNYSPLNDSAFNKGSLNQIARQRDREDIDIKYRILEHIKKTKENFIPSEESSILDNSRNMSPQSNQLLAQVSNQINPISRQRQQISMFDPHKNPYLAQISRSCILDEILES